MLMAGGVIVDDEPTVSDGVLAGRGEGEAEEVEALDDRPRVGLVATGGIGLEFDALLA